MDATFPDGADGPCRYILRARDLRTDAHGAPMVTAEVEVVADIDMVAGLQAITSTPPDERLGRLMGANPFVRWGTAVDELLPDERASGSLLYLVLDALAGWSRLASFGVRAVQPPDAPPLQPPREMPLDNCAGWRRDATIPLLHTSGQSAAEFLRPVAPSLGRDDDAHTWHHADPLPHRSMRRRRRIDVVSGDDHHPTKVDAMFRDTHAEDDGSETVLHEYTLQATIDPASFRVLAIEAAPRALPYQECPWATGSVHALVGEDVREMRTWVRKSMRGPSTCIHLNEFLRTFGDIGAMAQQLAQ